MSETNLRNALALLQEDPESEEGWGAVASAIGSLNPTSKNGRDIRELVAAAREAHEARREYDAVARLLAHG
jgi:hypothetical protein